MSIQFSIITPCFKGELFLNRAYKSLLDQSNKHDFEWIIVDDYSDDEDRTKIVIESLKKKAPFRVSSIFLDKNYYGSKSVYIGSLEASGNYVVILDQDDMLVSEALDIFAEYILLYGEQSDFAGVTGRCIDLSGELIGTTFPWDEKLSNEFELRHVLKNKAELLQCTKKNLITEYFNGAKPGFTNGWVWSRISLTHQFLYTNKVVRIYDTENPLSTTHETEIKYVDNKFEQYSEYLRNFVMFFNMKLPDKLYFYYLIINCCSLGIHANKRFSEIYQFYPGSSLIKFTFFYLVGFLKALCENKGGKKKHNKIFLKTVRCIHKIWY